MYKKKGFSLVELLTALLVLGILTAAILPAITRVMPNQNKIMIKGAYYSTVSIVKDIIDNGYFYLMYDAETSERAYSGFDDIRPVTYKNNTYSGKTKFVNIFLLGLKYNGTPDKAIGNCAFGSFKDESSESGVSSSISDCITVKTTDGMKWSFAIPSGIGGANWNSNIKKPIAYIFIDVNGDKAPNCYQGSSACAKRTNNFDQFRMSVAIDGTVKFDADDVWAKNTIKINSSINGDD